MAGFWVVVREVLAAFRWNNSGFVIRPSDGTDHALGDPVEIKMFYDDLITTGRGLGVSMPVMESYGESIRRFAATEPKDVNAVRKPQLETRG